MKQCEDTPLDAFSVHSWYPRASVARPLFTGAAIVVVSRCSLITLSTCHTLRFQLSNAARNNMILGNNSLMSFFSFRLNSIFVSNPKLENLTWRCGELNFSYSENFEISLLVTKNNTMALDKSFFFSCQQSSFTDFTYTKTHLIFCSLKEASTTWNNDRQYINNNRQWIIL